MSGLDPLTGRFWQASRMFDTPELELLILPLKKLELSGRSSQTFFSEIFS